MKSDPDAAALAGRSWPRVIAALVIRETSARFGRSRGGYLWAVAEPLGGIVLLTVVVSFVTRLPPLGSSFMLFFASGILPFLMYNSVATAAMNALQQNRGLLSYPAVTALDTVLARGLLEALTYCVIAALILPAILLSLRLPVGVELAGIALSLAMAASLGLGVGLINAVVIGFLPSWRNIWSVLNRPVFIISGVLFSFDTVPPELRGYLLLNPIAHVIGQMREGIYGPASGEFVSPIYVFGVALGLFVTGGFLLCRNEARLIQE